MADDFASVFLSLEERRRLREAGVGLAVRRRARLLAVTANPTAPARPPAPTPGASSSPCARSSRTCPCSTSSLTSGQRNPDAILFARMPGKLGLSTEQIERCRAHARRVAEGVRRETEPFTTVSTERTVLRLLGVDGVDADEVPIPNRVVASLQEAGRLSRGAAVWMGSALARGRGQRRRGRAASVGSVGARRPSRSIPGWRDAVAPLVEGTLETDPPQPRRARAPDRRASARGAPPALRDRRDRQHPRGRRPGRRGRPRRGPVHRGHPFDRAVAPRPRSLRRDDRRLRRDLRHAGKLPADAGGARPPRARDRPLRPPRELLLGTLHARDRGDGRARAPRHDVERRALRDHLPGHQPVPDPHRPELLAAHQRGRGRRHQHRRGQLPDDRRRRRAGARRCSPRSSSTNAWPGTRVWPTGRSGSATPSRSIPSSRTASSSRSPRPRPRARSSRTRPLKYMPPTKHMTGNVFRGYQQNALFVLTSVATGQSIHLLGMLTEALHTPFLHDRWLAIEQARDDPAKRPASLRRDRVPARTDAWSAARARSSTAPSASSPGSPSGASSRRWPRASSPTRGGPATRARGYDGVVRRDPGYANPFLEAWSEMAAGRRRERGAPVRPYGDKKGDGAVQISFTLPVPKSAVAVEAAKRYVAKMGIREPYVTLAEAIAPGFTYFVVYGRATHDVDLGGHHGRGGSGRRAGTRGDRRRDRAAIRPARRRSGLRPRERRPHDGSRRDLQHEGITPGTTGSSATTRSMRATSARRFRWRRSCGRSGTRRRRRAGFGHGDAERDPRPAPDRPRGHARSRGRCGTASC